jgi:hypothetical protein
LSGIFQFHENEGAANLKIVSTVDILSHSAQKFDSQPVPLVLTEELPTAEFTLTIENDFDEESRSVIANDGCEVWCGDVLQGTPGTSFMFVPNQTSGSGANGEFTITTAGRYYQQGCRDYSCAKLITKDASLSGAVLG